MYSSRGERGGGDEDWSFRGLSNGRSCMAHGGVKRVVLLDTLDGHASWPTGRLPRWGDRPRGERVEGYASMAVRLAWCT